MAKVAEKTPNSARSVRKTGETTILQNALDVVVQSVNAIFFGSVSLVVQDSKIIQIEKLEKIRLCEAGGANQPLAEKTVRPADGGFRTRVAAAVDGLQYGKVLIQIQSRQVVQIERTEKFRVDKLAGLYGDGI